VTFLCLVEAMNLDTLFGDCEDLSTTRGGGLSVLNIGRDVAHGLGVPPHNLISGASQGLFRLDGPDAPDVRRRIVGALNGIPILRHATVFFAVAEEGAPDRFQKTLADLQSDVRWQQMQAPSVVYPELKPGAQVCMIDLVRPAEDRHDLPEKKTQSDFSYERRQLGRRQRRLLLQEILNRDDFEVAEHLSELAAGGPEYGNARDKIALLRFDGNSFGDKYVAQQSFTDLQRFSRNVKDQQKRFFQALLQAPGGSIPPEWWAPAGRLRVEIVVYGGDEVTFIVPAWLGWEALQTFYQQAQSWPEVSYSGAVVFCHHKTPIHSVKRLASQLVDEAKTRGGRTNAAMYQVLESFDAIGRDLTEFLNQRFKFAAGRGVCLGLADISALATAMPVLRATISRRKLHQHVRALIKGGNFDFNKTVSDLIEGRNVAPAATRQLLGQLHGQLGPAAFLHILELWDYIGG
jgi:hypothetical protein